MLFTMSKSARPVAGAVKNKYRTFDIICQGMGKGSRRSVDDDRFTPHSRPNSGLAEKSAYHGEMLHAPYREDGMRSKATVNRVSSDSKGTV